ncbi:DUF4376 domain-containing protein [Bradyrhizobium sp. SZCCHNRI1058]|uniref:DUF4376 domain-containing protein n=1 Tax=Bradyrhizobium sp. SZCCHNRI1058 TaxID=3057279 RepID=UPI002916318B|nr:DUF4376 domain-containing protein [Bradyrhizobium sp. SZCCHNRI1058]
MRYDPTDWYWRASDGRVLSSAARAMVAANDPAYLAWLAAGNRATPWPVDAAGAQTTAALQDVLTPFDVFVDLKAYAAFKRYAKETAGTAIDGVTYLTDRETQSKMAAAVLLAQVNSAATFKWKIADGSFVTLDAATMITVATAVGSYVQQCFAAEAMLVTGINAGTITKFEQVDAAFA